MIDFIYDDFNIHEKGLEIAYWKKFYKIFTTFNSPQWLKTSR